MVIKVSLRGMNTHLTNLMNFCSEMAVLADGARAADIIYSNFSKIFHIVFFKILIDKLMKCGLYK